MADIYFTSDMHSYLYDTDYIESTSNHGGYFLLSQHFDPEALVVDGGDVLQGSPLAREVSKQGFLEFPQAKAMNAAGVRIFVPGNHDFNFGYEVFRRFVSSLDAVLVCANLFDTENAVQCQSSYTYRAKDGMVIGVVGVVTDYVNVWEEKESLASLRITDAVAAATQAYETLQREKPDYTVCVYHGGYNDSYSSQGYRENRANELSRIGFDLLLTSHQHTVVQPFQLGTAISLQCGSRAMHYAKISCTPRAIVSAVFPVGQGPVYEHPAIQRLQKEYLPLQEKVVSYLKQEIGATQTVFSDIGKLESALHGSSLADFFNQIQLEYTKSDVSCVSLFNEPRSLGPTVTSGDVIAVYPFPNTLVVVEANGTVLKQALERCAAYFDLVDGKPVISQRFLNPKVEHYNYDFYQNISYEFDLTKALGDRVVKLLFQDHDLLKNPDYTVHLAMNNYRATGTGGYEWFSRCPVVARYKIEVQELILETFEREKVVKSPPPSDFVVRF